MHILLVNDDGPPSNQHSPYVHCFAKALQNSGHLVSVVLPHIQRSWIGKAHMIGQVITPTYFRPGTLHNDDGVTSSRPFEDGGEEWILLDGTPASCVQVGLYYLFKDRPPVDAVVSGPNYGRNTTAIFALSSGTIGGALEASVCGKRSIALSYAFDKQAGDHLDPECMAGASEMSTRLIEKLVKEWPEDVQSYCINVPLGKGAKPDKILYTEMLQNQWTGSSFKEVVDEVDDADPGQEESEIREGKEVNGEAKNGEVRQRRVKYKWSPKYSDVWESSISAGHGDGWAVLNGCVSVTPLRANFWHLPNYKGEIKLDERINGSAWHKESQRPPPMIYASVDYPDSYVQPLFVRALRSAYREQICIIENASNATSGSEPFLQFAAYEKLNFERAMQNPATSLVCSYVIRKALIRKHYLSSTISTWIVKHPASILRDHFKPCIHFELDYAEFLDDALVDAWDLNESMERNAGETDLEQKEWWILKPGMSDGGNGIRLFSSLHELQAIFEEWDPEDTEDEMQETDESSSPSAHASGDIMTSQLRHFIAQPYIDPPLLLPSMANHKFHIRTYVLAVGALKVYVYKEMLALFAAQTYQSPSSDGPGGATKMMCHLTNTCSQDESNRTSAVRRFWSLTDNELPSRWQDKVFAQICSITGEVFKAAARDQMIHFQTIPNAFEIFGVDFLLDQNLNVWLLELNAYPDFKQTGQELQDLVISGLFEEVVKVAVQPFFDPAKGASGSDRMSLVLNIDLGRR